MKVLNHEDLPPRVIGMKVVCLPTLVVDHYPEIGVTRLGGNALNCAVQYRKSGVEEITVMGAVGDDSGGRAIVEFVRSQGFHSMIEVLAGETATNQMIVDEQGERFSRPGSWNSGVLDIWQLKEEQLDFINSQDLCSVSGHGEDFEYLARHAGPNVKIAADYMHFGDFDLLERTLGRIGLAFLAGNEHFMAAAREASRKHAKPVVVTLGAKGSVGFYMGREYPQPAIAVEKVVDTTGCGDAFQSACAYSFFATKNLGQAMLEGAMAASRVLAFHGGTGETGQSM